MAKEYFYGGRAYSTDSEYSLMGKGNSYNNFTGYNANFSSLSSAVDPRTANQIKEVSETLNTGIKNIEMGSIQPDVFESIPKEQFREINRLSKLAGAEISFHAPMIDPTGITQQGWDEMTRKQAELQLWDAIEKSQVLNPNGTVVTIHATGPTGLPSAEFKTKHEGKEKTEFVLTIDTTGKIGQIKNDKKYFPNEKGEIDKPFDADALIKKRNSDIWDQTLGQMTHYVSNGVQIADRLKEATEGLNHIKKEGLSDENGAGIAEQKKHWEEDIKKHLPLADMYLRDSYRQLKEYFDMAYKNSTGEKKETLDNFRTYAANQIQKYNFDKPISEGEGDKLDKFTELIERGIKTLHVAEPEILKSLKTFAVDKAAETTANLAWKGYDAFGGSSPIIALENHPAQQALLTTGEELRDVVVAAQKKFIDKAMNKGMSQLEAQKQAEKLIGATWDVGHINMLRKYGYGEKDILEQTSAVAPYVKKIHLADNFGLEHTELPMGMGNVPIKEMMARLGKEGFEAKKVIEAGNWWQHFSQGTKANGPLMPTLAGMGAPIYAGGPSQTNVGWNQMYGIPGGYFSGYGTMLPDQNFLIYGAGFTTLPAELGGQIANKDSRFSGTPMA